MGGGFPERFQRPGTPSTARAPQGARSVSYRHTAHHRPSDRGVAPLFCWHVNAKTRPPDSPMMAASQP